MAESPRCASFPSAPTPDSEPYNPIRRYRKRPFFLARDGRMGVRKRGKPGRGGPVVSGVRGGEGGQVEFDGTMSSNRLISGHPWNKSRTR